MSTRSSTWPLSPWSTPRSSTELFVTIRKRKKPEQTLRLSSCSTCRSGPLVVPTFGMSGGQASCLNLRTKLVFVVAVRRQIAYTNPDRVSSVLRTLYKGLDWVDSSTVVILNNVGNATSFVANLLTIVASGIAIYLFVAKRDVISSAFKTLLNYAHQVTLTELNAKLEKLNDLNADESSQKAAVVNVLNDIVGQINGNKRLKVQCSDVLKKAAQWAENPRRLTEPRKRSLVSELRETLKHVVVKNFDELAGG